MNIFQLQEALSLCISSFYRLSLHLLCTCSTRFKTKSGFCVSEFSSLLHCVTCFLKKPYCGLRQMTSILRGRRRCKRQQTEQCGTAFRFGYFNVSYHDRVNFIHHMSRTTHCAGVYEQNSKVNGIGLDEGSLLVMSTLSNIQWNSQRVSEEKNAPHLHNKLKIIYENPSQNCTKSTVKL